ncbi:MAG TPA: hypothetical protein VIQ31_09315, partial [Phormidium sp.]
SNNVLPCTLSSSESRFNWDDIYSASMILNPNVRVSPSTWGLAQVGDCSCNRPNSTDGEGEARTET